MPEGLYSANGVYSNSNSRGTEQEHVPRQLPLYSYISLPPSLTIATATSLGTVAKYQQKEPPAC